MRQCRNRNNQRATAIFFLYFLAFFSEFLSILIPFLTPFDPHLPCVPRLPVWHFMWSKAKPRRSNSGGALRYSRHPAFPLDEQHEIAPRPPHEVGCHNQRKQPARREIFREDRSWRKGGWREKNASIPYNNPKAIKESECSEKQEL